MPLTGILREADGGGLTVGMGEDAAEAPPCKSDDGEPGGLRVGGNLLQKLKYSDDLLASHSGWGRDNYAARGGAAFPPCCSRGTAELAQRRHRPAQDWRWARSRFAPT